jgi:hypothetical protein
MPFGAKNVDGRDNPGHDGVFKIRCLIPLIPLVNLLRINRD